MYQIWCGLTKVSQYHETETSIKYHKSVARLFVILEGLLIIAFEVISKHLEAVSKPSQKLYLNFWDGFEMASRAISEMTRDDFEGYRWDGFMRKTAKTKKYGVRFQMISYIMHQESPGIAWNGPELSGIARNRPESPRIARSDGKPGPGFENMGFGF